MTLQAHIRPYHLNWIFPTTSWRGTSPSASKTLVSTSRLNSIRWSQDNRPLTFDKNCSSTLQIAPRHSELLLPQMRISRSRCARASNVWVIRREVSYREGCILATPLQSSTKNDVSFARAKHMAAIGDIFFVRDESILKLSDNDRRGVVHLCNVWNMYHVIFYLRSGELCGDARNNLQSHSLNSNSFWELQLVEMRY